jgi:hypothetical protein
MRVATQRGWLWVALLVATTWFVIVGAPTEGTRDVRQEASFRIDFVEEQIHISVDVERPSAELDVAAAPPRESGARR